MVVVRFEHEKDSAQPYRFTLMYQGNPGTLTTDGGNLDFILSLVRAYLRRHDLLPLPREQLEVGDIPDQGIQDLVVRQLCAPDAGNESGVFVFPKKG